jgi:hypothetical protein
MEKGFCIAHILDIVSACEAWFTFVFRAHEHRAVGSSGERSYRLSWVFPFGTALPSPLYLDYITD